MKKAMIVFMMLLTALCLYAADNGDNFEAKAADTAKIITQKQVQYISLKAQYDDAAKKIDSLKASKDAGPFKTFINSIMLNYYLKKGNNLGFKTYALSKQIAELKDDYFTFTMLVIEDNAKLIDGCVRAKCSGLKELYEKRKKWIKDSGSFSEMMDLDLSVDAAAAGVSDDAAKDTANYIGKKIVQADERLYMLKEEKEILDSVKKAGLDINDSEIKEINAEIQKLQDSKKRLKGMLKK
jgi:hypothetical protein